VVKPDGGFVIKA